MNNLLEKEVVSQMNKEKMMNIILFYRDASPNDEMMINLFDSTYQKISDMNEEEYNELKSQIPLNSKINLYDADEVGIH